MELLTPARNYGWKPVFLTPCEGQWGLGRCWAGFGTLLWPFGVLLLGIVGASVGRMDKMAVDSKVPGDLLRAVLISTIE